MLACTIVSGFHKWGHISVCALTNIINMYLYGAASYVATGVFDDWN